MRRSLALALVAMVFAMPAASGATRVIIGTGPWGGVFFPVGSALATIVNRYVRDVSATAEPVEGSAHALELLHSGHLTLAIVTLHTAHFGVRGEAPFDKRYDNVAFVMAGMDAGQTLVTLADSGIHTYADVRGLRVGVNTATSRALLVAALKLYGVHEDDVRLTFMNFAEQIAALREGEIDAGFIPVTPYNGDVSGLASGTAIRVLGLDPGKAKAFEAAPYWTPVVVRARTYEGQDGELTVPGTHTVLLAHKHADPTLIFRIVKAIIDHRRAFGDLHPGGGEFTADKTRLLVERNLVPAAFHPGAERYWREVKVLP